MSPDGDRGSTASPALQLLREVWSGGDLALIDELVTDDYVHSDSVLPDLLEGPAALREWVETVRTGTPDMTKTVRETYVDGDAVIIAYTARGTHEGDIFGIAPTGRSLEVDGVCVSRVADGRLVESTDVWDAFGLFAQLGTFLEGF
ncbi:ester cyclase [Natrarchaeobaculum aegyptiacum]|uniref:Ketosteroid isomerase n=1 Tax=Natrarchaeobaculum aegyptiacum TaxID=745377 RepID=A0A2Z2HV07_9EURY|nr:ester cyclase [Natrarchaeobaculum aegyptiacum]ARS89995.1 ketosteroid isomerase [Natrarchaeobaculum aegyptiacum]